MAATITTFGEWHDSEGDPWDAARDTFCPDFDYDAGTVPAAALQSSLYPNVPSVLLMSTPEVRLAVTPFAVCPLPGSGVPLCHHAFSGDSIERNLPAIIDWTEECFALAETQVLVSANVLAAWAADAAVARPDDAVAPAGKSIQTRRVMPLPHRHVTMALTAQRNGILDWQWLWANVATPIVEDAALTTACAALLDCLRAASANQAGPSTLSTSRALAMADDPTGHLIGAA